MSRYRIKQVQEDFVVKEVSSLPLSEGEYSYFLLRKQGISTQEAVRLLARKLRISRRRIGVAGSKDKDAVTEQAVSIYKGGAAGFSGSALSLEFLGNGSEPLSIGSLQGNLFRIAVRNLEEPDVAGFCQRLEEFRKNGFLFPNYFDEQRFAKNNLGIGRAILKGDYAAAVRLLPSELSEAAARHLAANRNDYAGVLSRIPLGTRLFFLNSVQSLLFNHAASRYFEESCPDFRRVRYSQGWLVFPSELPGNCRIPLVGFGTELEGRAGAILKKELEREEVQPRDFIARRIPGMSLEGGERSLLAGAQGFSFYVEEDELNPGLQKAVLEFGLGKGCYATILVKTLFEGGEEQKGRGQ